VAHLAVHCSDGKRELPYLGWEGGIYPGIAGWAYTRIYQDIPAWAQYLANSETGKEAGMGPLPS